jgi:hypothetical protein
MMSALSKPKLRQLPKQRALPLSGDDKEVTIALMLNTAPAQKMRIYVES